MLRVFFVGLYNSLREGEMSEHIISRALLHKMLVDKIQQAHGDGLREGKRLGYWQGYQQGAAETLCLVLEQQFEPLDAEIRLWLLALPVTDLGAIARHIHQCQSLAELRLPPKIRLI